MLNDHLEEVDDLLYCIMQIDAGINSIETSLVTCSFGSWQGAAAQEAWHGRQQIVAQMNHAQDYLSAAEVYLDEYRNTMHTNALTLPEEFR